MDCFLLRGKFEVVSGFELRWFFCRGEDVDILFVCDMWIDLVWLVRVLYLNEFFIFKNLQIILKVWIVNFFENRLFFIVFEFLFLVDDKQLELNSIFIVQLYFFVFFDFEIEIFVLFIYYLFGI